MLQEEVTRARGAERSSAAGAERALVAVCLRSGSVDPPPGPIPPFPPNVNSRLLSLLEGGGRGGNERQEGRAAGKRSAITSQEEGGKCCETGS